MNEGARSYKCEGCKGEVAIPKNSRSFTLEQIRQHHDDSCPRPVGKRKPKTEEVTE